MRVGACHDVAAGSDEEQQYDKQQQAQQRALAAAGSRNVDPRARSTSNNPADRRAMIGMAGGQNPT